MEGIFYLLTFMCVNALKLMQKIYTKRFYSIDSFFRGDTVFVNDYTGDIFQRAADKTVADFLCV